MMKADSEETEKNPWTTLSSETRYDNNWITVTEHQVLTPAQSHGIYGTVHFKHLAVGIVPIDDEGFTWLVGQYRYPLKAWSWEIPEGGGKLAVSPLETAKRELKEETGIEAEHWEQILEMHLSNSVSDERAIIFLATGLTEGTASPDETEVLTVRKISLNDAIQMVEQSEITDAMSVAGLLKAALLFKGRW
jgi:8-oxo-dGTP pyrophosphatase MutT (NUDIX family)